MSNCVPLWVAVLLSLPYVVTLVLVGSSFLYVVLTNPKPQPIRCNIDLRPERKEKQNAHLN